MQIAKMQRLIFWP